MPFSLIAFIKSLLHLIRFQTKYSILLVINSFFATLLAFLNLLFLQGSLGFLPASSMYLIFLLLAIIGIVQNIIGGKENEKNKDYIAKSGKDSMR